MEHSTPTARRVALLAAAILLAVASLGARAADSTFEQDRRDGEARCRADWQTSVYLDCACVGKEVASDVAATGIPNHGDRDAVVWEKCPPKDTAPIEAERFKRCESAHANYRTDHEQYCHCVAASFAKQYVVHPDLTSRNQEMILRNAYVACAGNEEAAHVKPSRAGPEWSTAGVEKQRAAQEESCKLNHLLSAYVDCACASRKMVDLATAPGETRPIYSFQQPAFEACPQQDHAVVARNVFESCDSFMVTVRKDHESFCQCTAQEFVKSFYAQTPQLSMRWREKLRSDAMTVCGVADRSKKGT